MPQELLLIYCAKDPLFAQWRLGSLWLEEPKDFKEKALRFQRKSAVPRRGYDVSTQGVWRHKVHSKYTLLLHILYRRYLGVSSCTLWFLKNINPNSQRTVKYRN
jgi:hypothetical protein